MVNPLRFIPGVLFLSLWPHFSTGQPRPRARPVAPDKGVFLVARADMGDPRFQGSVILLVRHDENGTVGFIINRATEVPLSEALPDLPLPEGSSHKLYFGGPVGLDGILFLTRSEEPLEGTSHVMEDVYFGGDRKLLNKLLQEKKDHRQLRLYLGYSGWSPGQLAGEIKRGSWRVLPADAHTTFEKDLDTIWRDLSEPPPPPATLVSGEGGPAGLPGRAGREAAAGKSAPARVVAMLR